VGYSDDLIDRGVGRAVERSSGRAVERSSGGRSSGERSTARGVRALPVR
jgi:hypothetical protein